MSKKIDIKKQLMMKYTSFTILMGILFLALGVVLAKRIVIDNSAELLANFAKETGKNISNIIELEIEKVEVLANTPILRSSETNEEEKLDYLREIVQQHGYKEAALADLSGRCINTKGEETNISELTYFKKNLQGESFFTAPYLSDSDDTLQIAISIPLMYNGKITGAVIFIEDADKFSNLTNELAFKETGTAYVVDQYGNNIFNRDINKVINKVNRIEDAKTKPEYEELGAITEKMIAGESGTGSYILDGNRKFLGYAPISAKGWSVGVTVEIKDMLSGLKNIVIYMGFFTVIIVLGMIILNYKIATNFSRRLTDVQNEINQMVRGDFTLNKKNHSIMDEISEIDNTLQAAKLSLSEMMQKLQVTCEKRK